MLKSNRNSCTCLVKTEQVHCCDLRAIGKGDLFGIAMWVVDAHSVDRHGVPLCIKTCSSSHHKTKVDKALQYLNGAQRQRHSRIGRLAINRGLLLLMSSSLCSVIPPRHTICVKHLNLAETQGRTNIEGLISVRDGAGEVQQQDVRSAVVEEKLGALQHSSPIMLGARDPQVGTTPLRCMQSRH